MDARFRNLRAYGAFLVSSSMVNGKILSVTIKSENGRPLIIENPWKNSKVEVLFGNGKKEIFEGDILNNATEMNETIVITQIQIIL